MGIRITEKKGLLFVTGIALMLVLLGCANAPSQPQTEPDIPTPAALLEVSRIGLEESKTAFDSGQAVFVDVRSATPYAASHIPGALSIPLAELEPRIAELDPDQWIITYCT